ncbi:MAG: hypothetical protein K0S68_1122 [Candidatus Saccharibacteria bacterium]|jgi:hypothetical protein|nr:hypothetical protein [Candidatus Saccharibacteria bacterium]
MFFFRATATKLAEGKLHGHPYKLSMLTPFADVSDPSALNTILGEPKLPRLPNADHGRILLIMELPHPSPAHVAGFGLKDPSFAQALHNTGVDELMEQVELEGHFPNHFRLYIDPSHQVELRQVLDPATMHTLVETSDNLQWELFGNTLIFTQSDQSSSTEDSNGLVEASKHFLERLTPLLKRLHAL